MTALGQSPSTSAVKGSKSQASLYPGVTGILCYPVAEESIKVREWKVRYVQLVGSADKVYVWAVHAHFPMLRLLINAASIEKYQKSSEFPTSGSEPTTLTKIPSSVVSPARALPCRTTEHLIYEDGARGWCSVVQQGGTQTGLKTLPGTSVQRRQHCQLTTGSKELTGPLADHFSVLFKDINHGEMCIDCRDAPNTFYFIFP